MDIAKIQKLLGNTSPTSDRVTGLNAIGLTDEEIAFACGVSAKEVGLWRTGQAEPCRIQPDYRLDDLRTLALGALEAVGSSDEPAVGRLRRLGVLNYNCRDRFDDADLVVTQGRYPQPEGRMK